MTTRMLSSVTEAQDNSMLLVFLSSPDLVSPIQLCVFREGPCLNYMTKCVGGVQLLLKCKRILALGPYN